MHRPQNRTAALLAAFGCALAYLPAGRALAAVCAALPLSAAGQSFALHCAAAPLAEELVFRGAVQGLLQPLAQGDTELLQTLRMLASLNDTSLYASFFIS